MNSIEESLLWGENLTKPFFRTELDQQRNVVLKLFPWLLFLKSSRATTPDSSGSPRRFYFTPDSPCHKPYTETSKSQGGSPVHKSNKDTIYQVRRYSATGSPLHRSYTDGLQEYAGNHRTSQEDLRAQSDTEGDGSPDSSWRQRLFRRTSSALLRWKYRSTEDTALNVYLTYVTLPWHRIIGEMPQFNQYNCDVCRNATQLDQYDSAVCINATQLDQYDSAVCRNA
ncbi:hypothetical protein BSL78_15067 [Apostichopus japonicus]|uniref:Uncharacterized protein n=1 Tax=Stichopus japonicus TaxID=307972 RepID=A0A2G8KJA5_STIJA|nr:hypothetical protein BSL78_15067 [Apostichopus japonicus]